MNLYEKILKSFNKNHIEYLIVGGFAVNLYGIDRTTKDLDIWIHTTEENFKKLIKSFTELGYSNKGIKEAIHRLKNNEVIMIPDDENLLKVDIISLFSGFLKFDVCAKRKVSMNIGEIMIPVISIKDLIEVKKNTGREQDILDAKLLEKLAKELNNGKG